jgi:MtN3 and saliva related transmembrane protein
MWDITLLGLMAGTLTTAAFVPQVVQVWRTRSTKDISLGMFAVFSLGVSLWLLYGWFTSDVPVMIANAVTLVLALVILRFKLKFG